MLLRDIVPIILMIGLIGFVLSLGIGDLQQNYDFNTSESFNTTYNYIGNMTAETNNLQDNLEGETWNPFSSGGDSFIGSVFNVFNLVVNSFAIIMNLLGAGLAVFGLPPVFGQVLFGIIISTIVFIIASAFLKRKV